METVTLNENSGLAAAIRYFSDPMVCLEAVSKAKWPNGPECPRCQGKKLSFLKTRLMWTCLGCRKQFSVKVGTIFEDSPIGLDKWLTAMWMLGNCKNGVSSYEIARALEITQKSAWFMNHRIRYAMQNGSVAKMRGPVEADESYFGGKAEFMHLDRRTRLKMSGKMDRGGYGKTIVMGLLERNTREARMKVVATPRKHELRGTIRDHVEVGSTIYTDALKSYRGLPNDGFFHDFVDHAEAYVKGQVHTQGLENLWSLMKRAIKGTYVSVEPFHMQGYADEQCFRFNHRKTTDYNRFKKVLGSIAGKRLDWKGLTCQEVG